MVRVGRRRSFLGRLAFALSLTAMLACVSPTLPLPPPALPSITTGPSPDTVKLTSVQGAEPNALIIVVNRNIALPRDQRVAGTIADDQGSWDLVVNAKSNDVLDIAQESGDTRSPTTTVVIH